MMRRLSWFLCLLLLGGCATTGGYGQFYQSETSTKYQPTKNVRAYKYTEEDYNALLRDGYVLIGQSNFVGPLHDVSGAIDQGKSVGADIVLVDTKYAGARQGVLPIMNYHAPQTATINSYATASGNAYGPGGHSYGTASGYGTSYVTTPGYTTTQYVPYTVERHEQHALFLKKIVSSPAGDYGRDSDADDEGHNEYDGKDRSLDAYYEELGMKKNMS